MRELLDTMGADELTEWQAEFELEPWGELRGDLRTALLAMATTAPWRKRGDSAKLGDFMLDFPVQEKPKQTVQEAVRAAMKWTVAMGGKILGAGQKPEEPKPPEPEPPRPEGAPAWLKLPSRK